MDSYRNTRRQSAPKPESDLAEWTSKIKAMQRQVDADEEAEQRRLEEEIVAARQARMRRRSRGGRPTDSPDLSSPHDDTSSHDRHRDATERPGHQSEALRKIMGQNAVYVPELAGGRSDAVSLASFIGGRASGPRLNKHAPQLNTHDPTQFNQPDGSTPHPIFGRGGIAMPGMVSKKDLGGTSIKPTESNQRAISELQAVPSTFSSTARPLSDVSRNNHLSRPDEERRKSTSPTPKPFPGTEAAERYRPSASSTPSSTLHPQKSFDKTSSNNYGTEEAERYRPSASPTPSSNLRLQKSFDRGNSQAPGSEDAERYRPSASPSPTSTLRPQKSFDRSNIRNYGTEDAERYRPSPSPTPSSVLRPRRSFDNRNYGTEDAERYRPSTGPTPTSGLRPQKSFDRNDTRSHGTQDAERYRPSTSPTPIPGLRPQKSFDRSNNRSYGTEGSERYRPSVSPTPSSKTQKSFERSSSGYQGRDARETSRPLYSPTPLAKAQSQRSVAMSPRERSGSPQKADSRFPSPHPPKSIPDLRPQKSWTKSNEQSVSPQKTGGREHAISIPKSPAPEISSQTLSKLRAPMTTGSQVYNYLPPTQGTIISLSRERTISTPNYPSKGPVAIQPSGRSAIATASLARPIQPEPRIPITAPNISPSTVPSPAFQKAAQPKDVTPSISRLQGRGFVQNMVKTSLGLETNSAPGSTTSSPAPEKPRPSNLKKGSVLDRWQPQNQTPPSPVSPVRPTYSAPIRRATTAEPQSANRPASTPITTSSRPLPSYLRPTQSPATFGSEEPLTPRTTARMMEKMVPTTGNFGSATTAFVEKASAPPVDDFGVKRPPSRGSVQTKGGNKSASNHSRTSELPAPTGKPLIHPTKDRARRPKKVRPNSPSAGQETKEVVEKVTSATTREPIVESLSDPKIGQLTERWVVASLITPKATSPPARKDILKEPKQYANIQLALPGMDKAGPRSLEPQAARAMTPKKSFEQPLSVSIAAARPVNDRLIPVPPSPGQHTRIPSTGPRATVMEVAQALTEHVAATQDAAIVVPPSQSPTSERRVVTDKEEPRGLTPRTTLTPGATEKRKSSYESFIALPPLKEEATPAPSPANTLTRLDGRVVASLNPVAEISPLAPREEKEGNIVNLVHDDRPLPPVDWSIMMRQPTTAASLLPEDAKTISVDVISIIGLNTTTLTRDVHVFYDSEVLAVVHRCKVASGLVATYVWGWIGKRSQFGEPEEKKLHELARRYGAMPVIVRQCAEPPHLVHLLGGKLAIRQGARAHWAVDNTAMHLVRVVNDVVFIDEHDLNAQNLCSAFSYCISALGTVYVWYGTGSLSAERDAALQYAKAICGNLEVLELTQGENDDIEMFWMLLGEASFADADYWRWRKSALSQDVVPSIWKVNSGKRTRMVVAVEHISDELNLCQSVYIMNCIWELFVVVGANARGSRQNIRLALDVARKFAQEVSQERPYTPNVHVLILPSQLPLDLRLHVRDIDEVALNAGNIPDHMNLVSLTDAMEQLANTSWDRGHLKDLSMLPLGVGISDTT